MRISINRQEIEYVEYSRQFEEGNLPSTRKISIPHDSMLRMDESTVLNTYCNT